MTVPVPYILLALDGRVDFLKKTNPWGSSEGDSPDRTSPASTGPAPDIGTRLRRAFGGTRTVAVPQGTPHGGPGAAES
ncbi:hypothetical protein [Roseospira visakhapatnamensis]|uniref:Uncharacterized protein n=1 Tax=Roseospira visakhapatnamensis TaxID=390880 RepID=A0A7W6RAZ9_9PROT|nr:hypothetical protein [Roseospira visakhapatnamensis]MBB4265196.1 hypothetical protein [Roseospira visakhapatnamensis]